MHQYDTNIYVLKCYLEVSQLTARSRK